MTTETDDETTLFDELMNRSPTNRLERFAQNFRNMGVVKDIREGQADNHLIVYTNSDGLSPINIREKGYDFELVDVSYAGGMIRIVFRLESYEPGDKVVHQAYGRATIKEHPEAHADGLHIWPDDMDKMTTLISVRASDLTKVDGGEW